MTEQSDRCNFKCHIQSALSPQNITAWSATLFFFSFFFFMVRTRALGSEVIVQCPVKKKVANAEEKKRQEEVGERGQRVFCGVEGGERVLDPAVSARGTHFAGAQGVLSDGRTATAVFRNTSRPVYCLGAWVSALSSPTPQHRSKWDGTCSLACIPLPRAAKISPPGTRWNSKQNKLFLT